MSTHKHFDKICCVVLALAIILTVIFINAEKLGIQKTSTVMGYEKTLFDTSKVHTIEIVTENWNEFIKNCKSEEYYNCSVIIDNESYKNVAIRGKGNTSLTQVESYGNNRYSFKIEFDHYDSTKTYHGLDKLCLNNIIQDNTYMKDYLTYQMMREQGVASPLCSFAFIKVNGEDWGLYLAVEGIEESFLKRNYGNNYGELYKPDSMNMGGGRGNGKEFNFDDFSENIDIQTPESSKAEPQAERNKSRYNPNQNRDFAFPNDMQGEQMPSGMPPEKPNGEPPFENNFGEMPTPPDFSANFDESKINGESENHGNKTHGDMFGGNDDVKLQYIDDDESSYSNIFNNAKTDVTNNDKKRLIEALKNLSKGNEIENTVDIDAVIRYFVVHNFVLNFDSYTGSMVHNYYLYEKDGQMQMIPWDYNLAFGGFRSMSNTTELVNYPIDSPVLDGDIQDRPMIAWIFESKEYKELYHQIFSEYISEYFENGIFEETFNATIEMISPYVERDPTKFCTYDDFLSGAETLKKFCLLRAESIGGQLKGTIGSTDDTQIDSTLVDAGEINIEAMGTMNNSMSHDKGFAFDKSDFDFKNKPNDNGFPSKDAMTNSDAPDIRKDNGEKEIPNTSQNSFCLSDTILFSSSILILILGICFAFFSRRKK